MKLNKWLYGVTALAMLAACSDKDIAPGGGEDETGNGSVSSVNGYLAVEIKLPEDSGTRSSENDQFADGTSNEYQIDNAFIAIFKGADEKSAKFVRGQILKKPFFDSDPTDDNITSSYLAAIQVQSDMSNNDKFWALVFLNSDFVDPTSTSVDLNEFKIGNITVKAGTAFEDILNAKVNDATATDETNSFVKKKDKKYSKFFMTNAPVSNVIGNTAEITKTNNISYLTNIGNKVYDTVEEAKAAAERACVYVERAVAKLTCQKLTDDKLQLKFYDADGKEIDTNAEGAKWTISANVKYALSNTPYESYVVRNVELEEGSHFKWNMANGSKYRMISLKPMPSLGNPFHSQEKEVFRTYWCQDPHYATEIGDKKNKITNVNQLVDYTEPLYCKENTFNVANQNYKNTNIAIFEVDLTIKDGNGNPITDLYVRDGNTSKIYTSKSAVYADGITRILKNDDIHTLIKNCVKSGATFPDNEINNIGKYLEYVWNTDAEGNKNAQELLISKIKLKKDNNYFDDESITKFDAGLGDAATKGTLHYKLLTDVNALTDVSIYHDGKSYYAIPVKHFGDYYTPWGKDQEGKDIKGTDTKTVYNEGKDNWDSDRHAILYLGRYGMVRNNWYELDINKITALGSQSIPDVDIDLSDDNNEEKKYFAVEIHVLSWAKRTQSIDF